MGGCRHESAGSIAQFGAAGRDMNTAVDLSRRDLRFVLPLLAAGAGSGETPEKPAGLTSTVYHPDQSSELAGKPRKGGRIFYGVDHSGFQLEMHETVLGPGVESHPPHQHVHEEVMVVLEGTLQTYVDGRTDVAPTGSVVYMGSNQMHKVSNVGQVPVRYYVLELRGRAS